MQRLLNPGLGGDRRDAVVLVRRLLHLVHRGMVIAVAVPKTISKHLRDADFLGPLNALRLITAELIQGEVTTLSFQPVIREDLLHFFTVRENLEFASVQPIRRA